MSEILVFVELVESTVTDLSLQCLARARELADHAASRVACFVAGSGIGALPAQLVARGADVVLVADDPRLAQYLTTPYRQALAAVLATRAPGVLLLPSSTTGNDLAPRLAAETKAACVLDAVEVSGAAGALVFGRVEFDRKALATYAAEPGRLVVATLRDGVATPAAPVAGRTGEVVAVGPPPVSSTPTSRVVRRDVAKKTVNLKDAKVIVSGGAGVGSKEGFKLVEALAAALSGEVGATRAVVDAGWVSAERQVGQTGVTVRPDLYVACGISGAVQHRVGMMESKKIVAINTDAAAPIFKCAHYRVVGDVEVVVPKLLALLAQRRAGEVSRGR